MIKWMAILASTSVLATIAVSCSDSEPLDERRQNAKNQRSSAVSTQGPNADDDPAAALTPLPSQSSATSTLPSADATPLPDPFVSPDGALSPSASPIPTKPVVCAGQRFTDRGFVNATPDTAGYVNSFVIQPDGKTVHAAWVKSGATEIARLRLTRYLCDGAVDPTFGGQFAQQIQLSSAILATDRPLLFADSAGKLTVVLLQITYGNDGRATGVHITLAKTDANGNLEPTFGTNGMMRISNFGRDDRPVRRDVFSSAVLSDGTIAVAHSGIFAAGRTGSFLAKVRANGTIDNTFGVNGFIERTAAIETDNDDQIRAMIPQADGSFVAASIQTTTGGGSPLSNPVRIRTRLIKFAKNGSVDTTFGVNGIRDIENCETLSLAPSTVAAAADGILVGCQRHTTLAGASNFTLAEASIAKVLSNGNLDPSFGTNGRSNFRTRVLDIGNFNAAKQEAVFSIVRSASSNAIFAFTRESNPTVYNSNDFRIAKLSSTGQLDQSYGAQGVSTVAGVDFVETSFAAAILPDDRLMFSSAPFVINIGNGTVVPYRGNGSRLFRVLSNGQLDR